MHAEWAAGSARKPFQAQPQPITERYSVSDAKSDSEPNAFAERRTEPGRRAGVGGIARELCQRPRRGGGCTPAPGRAQPGAG